MKDSDQGAGRAQALKPNQLATVSERKLQANRENAKKSTGPKTPRGKAYSRRNALKHGLFVRHITDFEALREDPCEFQALINGLWDQYQPIGKAEEIEVERIALCCWRLKRSWRYENAVNLAARRDFVRRELGEEEPYCKERDKEEQAVILQLQSAKKELEETSEVSQELKQRIFAIMPGFEAVWSELEKAAQERVNEPDVTKMFRKLSPQWPSWALAIVSDGIARLEPLSSRRWINVIETAVGQIAIPNTDVVDKILRYEAMTEKSLSRALDRLERLQRRRRGELVPPPLSVHLTR